MSKRAFSLVELSIVLVILGLLVGGILAGQSLIRASELRSITTQHDQFVTAVNSFKDKYQYLPGDMPNAADFWGLIDPTPAVCAVTASATKAVCNGNGNANIESSAPNEVTFVWKELANAGLVAGSFTHVTGDLADYYPPGKISNSSWEISYYGDPYTAPGGGGDVFNGSYGNVLWISDPNSGGAIMTPAEVWSLDVKMDDGKPATGSVVVGADETYFDGINDCTDTPNDASDLTAAYSLNSPKKACYIVFRNQF